MVSIDAEFFRLHVLIGLSYYIWKCNLYKKLIEKQSYEQIFINNEIGASKKILITIFLKLDFFYFSIKFLNIASLNRNQKLHLIYNKKLRSLKKEI